MGRKKERHQAAAERTVKDIRRKTRKRYSSEEKIRIVLEGLKGGRVWLSDKRHEGNEEKNSKLHSDLPLWCLEKPNGLRSSEGALGAALAPARGRVSRPLSSPGA